MKLLKETVLDLLPLVERGGWTPALSEEFMGFAATRRERTLRFFLDARSRREREFPGRRFPGLFAEFDSISGAMRPPERWRVWTWGDCRALGIWSYLLSKGVVPASLKDALEDYCAFLHRSLLERMALNGGRLPFVVSPESNLALDDPRNAVRGQGEFEPGHVFAASAFMQYGVHSGNGDAFDAGAGFLRECVECGLNYRSVSHLTGLRDAGRPLGFRMVTLGAIVDTLKILQCDGVSGHFGKEALLKAGSTLAGSILAEHFDPSSGEIWETAGKDGKPMENAEGVRVCDPGHSAEACGFLAEFASLSGDPSIDVAALAKSIEFIAANGFSLHGVIYKNIDLKTRRGVCDSSLDGRKVKTSPWWNLRELSAASAKLFRMTGSRTCLEAWLASVKGSYSNYPNADIGGLMVQCLDAETLEPLPLHPATGNLDPMHCARALERECEAMQTV